MFLGAYEIPPRFVAVNDDLVLGELLVSVNNLGFTRSVSELSSLVAIAEEWYLLQAACQNLVLQVLAPVFGGSTYRVEVCKRQAHQSGPAKVPNKHGFLQEDNICDDDLFAGIAKFVGRHEA